MSDLLTAFTTGLVLLSSATTLVIMLAIYVFPLAQKFGLCMYQLSEDFTDYKSLKATSKFPDLKAHAFSGDILRKALTQNRNLTQEETLDILTFYEMRLNRSDGVDPLLADPDEGHVVAKRIANCKHRFYSQHGVRTQELPP